jgi:hypothetical protein
MTDDVDTGDLYDLLADAQVLQQRLIAVLGDLETIRDTTIREIVKARIAAAESDVFIAKIETTLRAIGKLH